VQGVAGLGRAGQRRHITFLDPGLAQRGARLAGEDLGPVPVAMCHRDQRSFAQRDREDIGRAGCRRDAGRILQGHVAAVEVAGKDPRDALQECGCRIRDALVCEPAGGLVGVGAHLVHSLPAQHGPLQSGPGFGDRVSGPRRIAVLPVINSVRPSFGVGRVPRQGGQQRGHYRSDWMFLDPALVFQPSEPPLNGGDPATPVGGDPEDSRQASCGINIPGRRGVLQRLLGQAVLQAPAGGAALQDGHQAGVQAGQLGQQHVAEQVVVAVPLLSPVQRYQQQVRPPQVRQHRRGPALPEHRIAQRPAHALQHRGPGQERPLPPGDPRQELRLYVVTDEPVIAAERDRRPPGRAAFLDVQRRQIQAGRPPLGPPVQIGRLIVAYRHAGVAQQ